MPTVLIVDDCETNRLLLGRRLARQGYRVLEADNGATGLEVMQAKRPDLALVDLLMPGVDGFEFVHQLRQIDAGFAKTPVIFITAAYLPEQVVILARSHGVFHVLTKPISVDEVVAVIEEALRTDLTPVVVPQRKEFTLALLQLFTNTLADNLKTVIPAVAEHLEFLELPEDADDPKAVTSEGDVIC